MVSWGPGFIQFVRCLFCFLGGAFVGVHVVDKLSETIVEVEMKDETEET